tara:strand:+ start:55 stop:993 length:939 start_codon:yes stop_codon:yes gene_type:complete
MKRVNYLNNRDLLKQIHLSKNTYCSYVSAEDSNYDIILKDVKKINASAISQARKNRAKKMTQEAWETAKANAGRKNKLKMSDFEVSPRKIAKTDLVFRIMTFDHIPEDLKRKNNPKTVADKHTKVNFPPFQHYRIDEKGKPKCVGKSHWIGGMANGSFSCTHGKITAELAKMYMKLCERYGTRSNWRGYTYNDEMQSQALMQLSQIGLQFDESKSENPFAYYTAAITNSFTRILNIEKKNQNIRDDIMEQNNLMPSMTRQMSELIAKQNKRIKEEGATVRVATKTSMAQFNRHYKKTGERKYDLLKYKEVKK